MLSIFCFSSCISRGSWTMILDDVTSRLHRQRVCPIADCRIVHLVHALNNPALLTLIRFIDLPRYTSIELQMHSRSWALYSDSSTDDPPVEYKKPLKVVKKLSMVSLTVCYLKSLTPLKLIWWWQRTRWRYQQEGGYSSTERRSKERTTTAPTKFLKMQAMTHLTPVGPGFIQVKIFSRCLITRTRSLTYCFYL